jgi:hypothetical protein
LFRSIRFRARRPGIRVSLLREPVLLKHRAKFVDNGLGRKRRPNLANAIQYSGAKLITMRNRQCHRVAGSTYELSEKPKSDIYRDMLPLLNSRKVQLLDDRRLLSQLHGLERRTARGGKDSIDHGPGAHDDIANAVAGALVLASANMPMIITDAVLAWSRAPQSALASQITLRTFEGRF